MIESARMLLVEDDPALAREVVRLLRREQHDIDHVASLGEAFEAIIQRGYRLILLDRRLPDGDGLSLIAAARSRPTSPAIIVLTARDDVADRVEGLDAGADDYLVKPFALSELTARMRAALRRPSAGKPSPPIEIGRMVYCEATRDLRIGGRSIALPRRELALFDQLAKRNGRVVQRAHLEDELFGFEADVTPNALEIQISRLRKRLRDADAGVEIRTIRGVGYMLRAC